MASFFFLEFFLEFLLKDGPESIKFPFAAGCRAHGKTGLLGKLTVKVANSNDFTGSWSLTTRNKMVELAPAYDFLNSCIVLKDPVEIALPIAGRQKNLTRQNLLNYFARERMLLNQQAVDDVMGRFQGIIPEWKVWIEKSFLSGPARASYRELLEKRSEVLGL